MILLGCSGMKGGSDREIKRLNRVNQEIRKTRRQERSGCNE
jgi:hypothetical protein